MLVHKSIPLCIQKTVLDPKGSLLQQDLILVNLYGPTNDDPNFYNNLFLSISSFHGDIIIGDDFNCTLDPELSPFLRLSYLSPKPEDYTAVYV